MKRHLNILVTSIILVSAFVVTAQAQTGRAPRVLANIPFAFNVGAKTLPAGRYAVTVLNPASDQTVLQIRSIDGRSTAIILTTSVMGNASKRAHLVFRRYGDQYFFAQAQLVSNSTVFAAAKSRTERLQAVAATLKSTRVVVFGE